MRLNYAIKFVADMDKAIAFYRDTLGLELKFASPFWTEFATGETTLALHPASDENPPAPCSSASELTTSRASTPVTTARHDLHPTANGNARHPYRPLSRH